MNMKYTVYEWRMKDKMKLIEILKKFKEEFNMDAAEGTLAGFYAPNMVQKYTNTARDRLQVQDVRMNPKQRPDVLVDMERVLARRCKAVGRTGIPYICKVVSVNTFYSSFIIFLAISY